MTDTILPSPAIPAPAGVQRLVGLPVLVGLLLIASFAINLVIPSMGDQPWMLYVARQMLAGEQIYVDLIETNPPLWFWSGMPVAWFADLTGMNPWHVLLLVVHGQAAVCVWLWDKLTRTDLEGPTRIAGLIAVVVAFTLVPVAETGQRENFTLMGTVVWCALVAARFQGRTVPVGVALLAGLFAAYGFALKHWFVLVPVLFELALAWKLKRSWRPIRPETVVMALAAGAYAAAVIVLTPEFFTRIVPLVAVAYDGFGAGISLSMMERQVWLAAPYIWLALVVVALVLMHDRRPVLWFLVAAAVILTAAALLQQKGFRYHALPVQGLGLLATVLLLMSARTPAAKRRLTGVLVAMGAAFILLPASVSLMFDGREIEQPYRAPAATLKPGERLAIVSVQPEHAFLLPLRATGTHLSRHYSAWMLPGLLAPVPDNPERDRSRLAQLEQVLGEFREDLMCRAADLVLLEKIEIDLPGGRVKVVDIPALLQADPVFASWLNRHYQRDPRWQVPTWRLIGPRPADRLCARTRMAAS